MSTEAKTPEQIAAELMDRHLDLENTGLYGPDLETTTEAVQALVVAAIEADREQRPAAPERIVVASSDGARTWIGGDTVAHLLETINGYLEEGYTPEELIIEGITR